MVLELHKVYVVGVLEKNLTEDKRVVISQAQVFLGSPEIIETAKTIYGDFATDKKVFPIVPLQESISLIRKYLQQTDIVVFASGDPLFYGVGKRISEEFGVDRVIVLPSLSSAQLAFSRFCINWEDSYMLSLHGRDIVPLKKCLMKHYKICLLTDPVNTPLAIAQFIKINFTQEFYDNLLFFIAQKIEGSDEQLFSGSIDEVLEQNKFLEPNVVIIKKIKTASIVTNTAILGLEEDDIYHSRGLITKNEVRAVSIHRLKLPQKGVLWDIGAGSGSVSIESSRMVPNLSIYSIERVGAEQQNILANVRKFQAQNISIVNGEAPQVLSDLPAPDRVFIGGSGGNLEEIINVIRKRMNKGGVVVINCVLQETADLAPKILFENGFKVEISKVSVSRLSYPEKSEKTFNTITVVSGAKVD